MRRKSPFRAGATLAAWALAAAAAAAPTIASLSPDSAPAGGGSFNLVITGSGFTSASRMQWNGIARPTSFQSGTELIAFVEGADVTVPNTATVTVADGGAVSNGAAFTTTGPPPPGCAPPANAVVAENCLQGSPSTDWDIVGAGDPSIQGFAADMSVNRGDAIAFKIKTDATAYRLDIYRVGFYSGLGARRVATVFPSAALPQSQPDCLSDPATALLDCGNWSVSASWQVPAGALSGVYFAKVTRADTGGASHIVFVVRDDAGRSDLLMQTSDTTWQAYNDYGGVSFYQGPLHNQAFKISYNRPFHTRETRSSWLFFHEYPMIRWLESNGYDVSYFSGVDTDRRGSLLLNHKAFLSVGHDEYWSAAQRAAVETARAAGVHLAFFSGNSVFWKTRWENSLDGAPYRTLVCYKESYNGRLDPADPPIWTGLWRDRQYSPTSDGGRPENALIGTFYGVDAVRNDALTVGADDGRLRFWRNTGVASLPPGGSASFPELLGYEWDATRGDGSDPPGLMRLSRSAYDVPLLMTTTNYAAGTAVHSLTLYRTAAGTWVFGAGTMQWAWGLDSRHDGGSDRPAQASLQQATVNLLAEMGVQPGNLRSGLSPAFATTDKTPPVSRVVSPAAGTSVQAGAAVTVAGTAADAGGGVVAGVEVSVDGGSTWRPAAGRENWSFSWTPAASGVVDARSRAVDDSGNLEGGAPASLPAPDPPPSTPSPLPRPTAADPAFAFHDLYAFPNPSRGGRSVTIRLQAGLADAVDVRLYDLSGAQVNAGAPRAPTVLDDGNGKGPQYTYDYEWDVSGVGSGVYVYAVTAKKAGQAELQKTGRVGVLK